VLLAVGLAFPAGAEAQSTDVTVTLTPPTAGKPSRLSVVARGGAVSAGQEAPKSVSLFIARGFKLDPRARKRRCTAEQARSYSCPLASRVATGSAQGTATVPAFGTFQFTATIEAFLTPRVQPGDIAGVVVQASGNGRRTSIQGRVVPVAGTGPFGAKLLFENFNYPAQQAPPGSSAKLDRFDLSVSAKRKVRKVRIVKRRVRTRHGVRIKRRRKVRIRRYYLIRNPRTCTGSWPYQLRATFPTRPEYVRDGTVPCSAG
jgi:hypothetical protein